MRSTKFEEYLPPPPRRRRRRRQQGAFKKYKKRENWAKKKKNYPMSPILSISISQICYSILDVRPYVSILSPPHVILLK